MQSESKQKTENYTTDSAVSKDGTVIGYRQLGQGPGVVVLHGTMESAASHMQFGEALASAFTVYLVDRRGRGMSGPFGESYSMQKEIDDLDAILTKTGAHYTFGVSAGAIISLHAARVLPAMQKAAIFEPPLSINGSFDTSFVARYEKEIADGDLSAAMTTSMLGAQMGPPIFNSLPRWLLKTMTTQMMKSEEKKAKVGDVTMRMLAPTFHYDAQLVAESEGKVESFKETKAEIILVGGALSPAYLKTALGALEKIFPRAKHVVIPGAAHGASGNSNRGGKPVLVANAMKDFYASESRS